MSASWWFDKLRLPIFFCLTPTACPRHATTGDLATSVAPMTASTVVTANHGNRPRLNRTAAAFNEAATRTTSVQSARLNVTAVAAMAAPSIATPGLKITCRAILRHVTGKATATATATAVAMSCSTCTVTGCKRGKEGWSAELARRTPPPHRHRSQPEIPPPIRHRSQPEIPPPIRRPPRRTGRP